MTSHMVPLRCAPAYLTICALFIRNCIQLRDIARNECTNCAVLLVGNRVTNKLFITLFLNNKSSTHQLSVLKFIRENLRL